LLSLVNNGAPVDKLYDEKWNQGVKAHQRKLDDGEGKSIEPKPDAFGFLKDADKYRSSF